MNKDIKSLLYVLSSSVVAAININLFVNAAGLLPGGMSGVSLLISRLGERFGIFNIQFGYIYLVLNAIIVLFFYKSCGKRFTFYSIIQVVVQSILTFIIPVIEITDDIILLSIFGGLFAGLSCSLALSGDASSGGTDFIAIHYSKRYNISTWNYIMAGNVTMLALSGFIFGWDKALYSIIYQFTVTQVINFLHLEYKRVSLFIITTKGREIADKLLLLTHHGVTKFTGEGAYTKKEKEMLFTVISSYELDEVISECKKIDPCVFIDVVKSEKISGRFYQRPIN